MEAELKDAGDDEDKKKQIRDKYNTLDVQAAKKTAEDIKKVNQDRKIGRASCRERV